jgi:hypothetical protein
VLCTADHIFLYLAAIKQSVHLDYEAVLKEVEESQYIKTFELDDLKPKGKRGIENHSGRGKAAKLTCTVAHERPETLEKLNEYAQLKV